MRTLLPVGMTSIDRLAVRVRFDLQTALVHAVLDGMEDHVSAVDRLLVEALDDGHFDMRGVRRRLVFAAMLLRLGVVLVLGTSVQRSKDSNMASDTKLARELMRPGWIREIIPPILRPDGSQRNGCIGMPKSAM